MSDLMDSIGMIFSTTDTASVDPGVMADAASALDQGAPVIDGSADVVAPTAPDVPDTASVAQPGLDTQPPAPVSEGATALPGSGVGNGIVDSNRGWFASLSPGAQQIIAKGVSGGAGAILAALQAQAQRNEAEKVRNQQREDYARRHQVPAISVNAFKPKGVIDAARG